MSKHPLGALRTLKEIDALLVQAQTRNIQLHCVWYHDDKLTLDYITLCPGSERNNYTIEPIIDKEFERMNIYGLGIKDAPERGDHSNRLGYMFQNYFHAYAYYLRTKAKLEKKAA